MHRLDPIVIHFIVCQRRAAVYQMAAHYVSGCLCAAWSGDGGGYHTLYTPHTSQMIRHFLKSLSRGDFEANNGE